MSMFNVNIYIKNKTFIAQWICVCRTHEHTKPISRFMPNK